MKSTDIIKASANSLNIYSFTAEALERLIEAVKTEQSCSTCEALARTVMLDQTYHDAQRTWQGLTDEERNDCLVDADPCECLATPEAEELIRCIEAKLKEKNT